MQGMIPQILANKTAVETPTAKLAKNSPEETSDFKAFFSNLFSSDSEKVEGDGVAALKGEVNKDNKNAGPEKAATEGSQDQKINNLDTLLKTKELAQNKRTTPETLTAEQALPEKVLGDLNKLLTSQPVPTESAKKENTVTENPLEFILKNAEGSNDGKVKDSTKLNTLVTEQLSEDSQKIAGSQDKVKLSTTDFLKNLEASKEGTSDSKTIDKNQLMSSGIDPKVLVQKQLNQSMKAYGEKQNILSSNIIKNTSDIALKGSKDLRPQASVDELQRSDLKIGEELKSIKEDFIPVMNKQDISKQDGNIQADTKVLDLSKVNTENTAEIIKRISDYVEQSQLANKDSLDLTVKHDSLGQFKIQVNRPQGQAGGGLIDMQILTSTPEGHEFFVKHEVALMKNLSQAGLQLSDLRIMTASSESMSFSQGDSKQSSQFNQESSSSREYMSFDTSDQSNGSQRRKELWDEYQQRYGA